MTPQLRFPEFTDEWQVKKLGDVFDRVTRKNKENNQNILTISAQDGLVSQEKFFSKIVAAKDVSGYYLLHKNDYAYNKSYSKGYPMGAIKRLSRDEKGVVSTLYICFSSKQGLELFFDQYFEAGRLNTEIEKIAQEGARNHGLLNMAVGDFFTTKLVIPVSKPEQEKIADFLTAVDERIGVSEKKLKLLETYKRGVMQKIFTRAVRFKDDNGNPYPDWGEKKLKHVLKIRGERNSKNETNEVFSVAKNAGVINQIEHLGRSFASKEISNYKVVRPGDIIYTKSPTSDFPYGIIKQNMTNRTGVVSVLYGVYVPVNIYIGRILDEYFKSWQNTYNYLNPIVQKGAKNTINIGDAGFLEGRTMHLPVSEDEQQKIANFLTTLDGKITAEKSKLTTAREFKKALLQRMFV